MRSPALSHSETEGERERLPEAGEEGVGSEGFTGPEFQVCKMRGLCGGMRGGLPNSVNVFKATELYTKKWLRW